MNWPAAAIMSLALAARLAGGASTTDCASCHDQEASNFKTSVHGTLACTNCHTAIRGYPHQANTAKVECNTCHAESVAGVAASVHAKAGPAACQGCHGDIHSILPKTDPKSAVYALNMPKTCGSCHGNAELAKRNGLHEVYSLYMDSIHGFALAKDGLLVAANCSSCHGSHKILSKTDPHSRTFRTNIPDTCGSCHAGAEQAYLSGTHGKLMQSGHAGAPSCVDCHTAHQIAAANSVPWEVKTTATCGGCHKEKYETYHDTFHAQVSALGYTQTARCWDCHGFHDVRPTKDPASMVAKANLVKTCGQCHKGTNAGFVTYQPHADSRNGEAYPLLHYAAMFMNLLLWGVMSFFLLHSLLWLIRSKFDHPVSPAGGQLESVKR